MKKWVIVLAIIFLIGIPIYAIYDFLVVELDELPEGEFLSEYPSPNGEYTARAYLIDRGGATVRTAIRVEIDFGNKVKTIYWSYDEHTVKTKWLDNETVDINNHQLNIFKDTYNWKEDPRWEDNRGRY
ncbi:hypothetical protein AEA09_00295 [Lysinibacillus contaminans]|uniref:DUF5412 domain-containing protein n=1 Tax=Lysinibacillus contaminans TaxID=1293441 RepID=A0ABR5K517_9BACI|nr:DUF5412 family protein [Lysinibacillus contaminans]KOS71488.1 hypothetical protein AEA09_00295 [Lysinibacillus contaminans]